MDKRTLVLATGNTGKLREMQALLADLGFALKSQAEFGLSSVPETGTTFVENAIIKARHAAAETGLPALADDSGLEVAALDGRPGVYSARFAGEAASDRDNLDRVLELLGDQSERSAAFRCVIVCMRHAADPMPLIVSASWPGRIADAASGVGGFGYDPIFLPEGQVVTAAEMTRDAKNAVSHRGQALALLRESIDDFLATS